MGAGARFAAERDRWPEHWRVADLEEHEDSLLALLQPSEELRAVVPGLRGVHRDCRHEVLVGVTDRRVVLVGPDPSAGAERFPVVDITQCTSTLPRGQRFLAHVDGDFDFDLDDDSVARVWATIDQLTP